MNVKNFKPMLLPNELTGVIPNWDERIKTPAEWLYSHKLDGGRVELYANGTVKGRSLKEIPSVHIQAMAKDIMLILQLPEEHVIEAEFYSPDMNFAEIMHFFRSEDVTSDKSVAKYKKLWEKTLGDPKKGWEFQGRDWKWCTTWHASLKFFAFSFIDLTKPDQIFKERYLTLRGLTQFYEREIHGYNTELVCISQETFSELDELFQAYDQAVISGAEGLVVTHKDTLYKLGRYTLNANTIFKIKDDAHEWDGQIIGVEEGTVAREGAEKTINELGRSKTSQLQEDRVSSGMAKGFKVRLDDGQELTVSLNGYNHEDRILLLTEESNYIGKWIRFKGMHPVKEGGLPRHAIYSRGNIRDEK